jgi:hypothetical protein
MSYFNVSGRLSSSVTTFTPVLDEKILCSFIAFTALLYKVIAAAWPTTKGERNQIEQIFPLTISTQLFISNGNN